MIEFLIFVILFQAFIIGLFIYKGSHKKFVGTIEVNTTNDEGGKSFLLSFDEEPYDLDQKKTALFAIKKIS